MSLIYNEIRLSIEDCEKAKSKMLREADRIREERKCYEHIRQIMGVIFNDTERNDIEALKNA